MNEVVRTCVVCRRVDEKQKLLRFVRAEDVGEGEVAVELDLCGSMTGRGAYCHEADECLFRMGALDSISFSLAKAEKRRRKKSGNRGTAYAAMLAVVERAVVRLKASESRFAKEQLSRAEALCVRITEGMASEARRNEKRIRL